MHFIEKYYKNVNYIEVLQSILGKVWFYDDSGYSGPTRIGDFFGNVLTIIIS